MDTTRLTFGDMVAGASALVLLITLFLPWYKASGDGESEGVSAWNSFALIDILLLLISLAVIALVVMRALGMEIGLPVPRSQLILGLGALALLLILFRLLVLPGEVQVDGTSVDVGEIEDAADEVDADFDFGRSFGIFLALLSAAAMTVGGWLMQNEPGGRGPGGPGSLGTGAGAPGTGTPAAGPPAGGGQAAPPTGGGQATQAVASPGAQPAAGAAGGGQPDPDWYPDPKGEARLRYWDGSAWTEQTSQ